MIMDTGGAGVVEMVVGGSTGGPVIEVSGILGVVGISVVGCIGDSISSASSAAVVGASVLVARLELESLEFVRGVVFLEGSALRIVISHWKRRGDVVKSPLFKLMLNLFPLLILAMQI